MKPEKNIEYPINELMKKRWSPRSFSNQELNEEMVMSLFEAAKWSASAFNEQPWRFIYALKQDGAEYDKLFLGLNEKNRTWANSAPMVGFAIAKSTFDRNNKINHHAWYDTGMAMSQLTLQAMDMNLYVHQMAGIDKNYLIETFGIHEPYDIICGFVIGYLGSSDALEGPMAEMENSAPSRKPLDEIIHHKNWN